METFVSLEPEVVEWLDEVSEKDNVPPEYWLRKKLREFCDPIYSQPLTLKGRKRIKLGEITLTYEEMKVAGFTPREHDDTLPSGSGVKIHLGKYLTERIPLCVAWVEYSAAPEVRQQQEWHTFSEWATVYLTSQIASAKARLDAEEDKKEEAAELAVALGTKKAKD